MEENNLTTTNQPKNIWLLIVSILLMIMGIYIIFNPVTALIASAILMGVLFIIMGLGYMMLFKTRKSYAYPIIGLFNVLIGIMFLMNLGLTTISMPIIFGFWCAFVGITYLMEGIKMKKGSYALGGMAILTGLLGILFGILVFLYPLVGVFSITFLLGAYLIICGAFEMGRYYQPTQVEKKA